MTRATYLKEMKCNRRRLWSQKF